MEGQTEDSDLMSPNDRAGAIPAPAYFRDLTLTPVAE
jgi:hypothetical protein